MRIRRANDGDSSILAKIVLLATRAHLTRGWFDVLLNHGEADTLRFLEYLTCTEVLSWWHHSRFWVAEAADEPAAALCCFRAADAFPLSRDAIAEVASRLSYPSDEQAAMWERGAYIFSCTVGGGDDVWTLENIATLPLHRRKGLTTALIEKALEEGQQKGHDRVQVSTFIGNDAAIRGYERLGFELVAEQRDEVFETVTGAPGLCRLERVL